MLRLVPFLSLLLVPIFAHALEIRSYVASRHDRFVTGASGWEYNPGAYYDSRRFVSVGFDDAGRQYPLVTPEHVLFARHFSPGVGTEIRFLPPSGEMISRSVVAVSGVPNGSGGFADVVLVKLSAPIPPELNLPPFPYLNLAGETAYTGTVLTTFGQSLRAGRGTIAAFSNFSNDGIDETRTFTFTYNTFTGNRDDAYAVIGDSGSPSFAVVNNRAALVGLHLAASVVTFQRSTIDTFVPHYASAIDALLAPQGYQLVRAYSEIVDLTASAKHSELRQAAAGAVEIELANGSGNTASNVRLNLSFPAEAAPSTISAPDWIIDEISQTEFRLRAATLAGNSSAKLTVTYSSLPVVREIQIAAVHRSDGSPELSKIFSVPVRPSFAGFVAGLPLQGPAADPDDDGVSNLIEYAFGGDPAVNSQAATAGYVLAPRLSYKPASLSYTFARRTDATERGLGYQIEFSGELSEGSWVATLPPGFSLAAAPFEPEVEGFEKVTVSGAVGASPRQFLRVRVTLDE